MLRYLIVVTGVLFISCASLQPVKDLKTPFKLRGISFLPPQGENWLIDEQTGARGARFRFFKDDEIFRNEKKQTAIAEVFFAFNNGDARDEKTILTSLSDEVLRMDQRDPDRHVIIQEENKFVTENGHLFLKKTRLVEDRKVPLWPDEIFYIKKVEVFTLSKSKDTGVMLNWSQRYPKSAKQRDLSSELDPYVKSLKVE